MTGLNICAGLPRHTKFAFIMKTDFIMRSDIYMPIDNRNLWQYGNGNKNTFGSKFIIMKTRLYNFDPHKLHFYIVKLGFTHYLSLFLLKNIDCGYSLEPPHRGGSNEYPQPIFWAELWKMIEILSKNFQFLEVKFSIHLNRHVFVMTVSGPMVCLVCCIHF